MRISRILSLLLLTLLVQNSATGAKTKKGGAPDFRAVDRLALSAPTSAKKSVASLAAYFDSIAKNDYEKARAIYRWITENIAYNTESYFSGQFKVGRVRPEDVLESGRAVCDGYANLFDSLGRKSGLETIQINGYSKGYGYSSGVAFQGAPNHAWNAVRIDGHWHLIDATWGAGYLNERGQFKRRFEDHYFLTPPEDFIFDHYPVEGEWQLLDEPISMEDYEQLVFLKPPFFRNNLSIVSHRQAKIECDAHTAVRIGSPNDVILLAQLVQGNRELEDSRTFLQRQQGEYEIRAVAPHSGEYILRIFAKRQGEEGPYHWALDYLIRAGSGAPDAGFPVVFAAFQQHQARLIAPLTHRLASGDSATFELTVPDAKEVIVLIDNDHHPLQKDGNRFYGNLAIKRGTVRVFARFSETGQFQGLLEYRGK